MLDVLPWGKLSWHSAHYIPCYTKFLFLLLTITIFQMDTSDLDSKTAHPGSVQDKAEVQKSSQVNRSESLRHIFDMVFLSHSLMTGHVFSDLTQIRYWCEWGNIMNFIFESLWLKNINSIWNFHTFFNKWGVQLIWNSPILIQFVGHTYQMFHYRIVYSAN